MSVCPLYPAILLVGDLNIDVGSKDCPFTAEFLNLLHAQDFSQFVNFATHTKDHTLDLVCSSGISPSNLHGMDLAVSDHKAFLFNISPPAPPPPQYLHASRTITYRNLKNISIPSLLDMLDTQLSSDYTLSSTDDLVSTYNALLFETLDHLAPLTSRNVSFRHSAPWLTNRATQNESRMSPTRASQQENWPNCSCLSLQRPCFNLQGSTEPRQEHLLLFYNCSRTR